MKQELIIIGAGGHAKVVLDAVNSQGTYTVKGFCADELIVGDKIFGNYYVLGDVQLSNMKEDPSVLFIVALGNNVDRKTLFENALKKFKAATVVHSSAVIGAGVSIAPGCAVLANAVVNASSTIGANSIIGTGVLIDHDCKIGAHCHLSLGTVIASKSTIADNKTTLIAEKIIAAQ